MPAEEELRDLSAELEELAGYVEGQQVLLDFLIETLAANIADVSKAELRRQLQAMADHFGSEEPESRPFQRALSALSSQRPRLRLIRGGRPPDAK